MVPPVVLAEGWTDVRTLIVPSDGSRSLGNTSLVFNHTRDQGSKIVYFDSQRGSNPTAGVYWWDGARLLDSSGSPTNPDNGLAYGDDPLAPNEEAIRPFLACLAQGDSRLRTQAGSGGPNNWRFDGLAGGYPDVFLFRRGQVHHAFDFRFAGGRSAAEPMVVAAYGPLADGRAIMDPGSGTNPFAGHNWGYARSWMHQALFSLEIRATYGYLGTHLADTYAAGGGPTTAYLEDCYWPGLDQGIIVYPPQRTTFRRCILTHCWRSSAHNQGYFSSGYKNRVTFDEVILYKNGYKEDPRTTVDPRRDIFSRNIYQGGGARLGHVYRNIISMDGGSGGPQIRLGGVIENSLIVEGYWYASTSSNDAINQWALADPLQTGTTALVLNNVQLVFSSNTPADPDLRSDNRAQPGWGFRLGGFSYGARVEGNIISGAMLADELGAPAKTGLTTGFQAEVYGNGHRYTQRRNLIQDNIVYRTRSGLIVEGDATGVHDVILRRNVVLADTPLEPTATGVDPAARILVDENRFYSNASWTQRDWVGPGNTRSPPSAAALAEGWPDPDRTLRRYVTEHLGLSLLDWADDPFLDPVQVQERVEVGEAYDPAGMRTFMAVATRMRRGGTTPIPSSGKPSLLADYPWDPRFTAIAVVNWIRAGFGLPPAGSSDLPPGLPTVAGVEARMDAYDGSFRVFIEQAHPRFVYRIQTSTDLQSWVDRHAVVPESLGFTSLETPLLPLGPPDPRHFYRLLVQPLD